LVGEIGGEQLTVTAARKSLGKQLAGLRAAANLTQYEFAHLVGYARSTVTKIEAGRQQHSPVFCRKPDEVLSTAGVFCAALEELQRESHRKAAASAVDERRQQIESWRQEQARTKVPVRELNNVGVMPSSDAVRAATAPLLLALGDVS
jgi:DNA-binding XRE family transcriptional regulator